MSEKENTSNIKNFLKDIKSNYILKEIFNNLQQTKLLNIIRYNQNIQKKLNKDKNNYRELAKIVIELIPNLYRTRELIINIINEKDLPYYHLYLNDNQEEMKVNYITRKDKAKKIKLIIDPEVKSFIELFKNCDCFEKINFIQFNRNNVSDMSFMFYGCSTLKEINFFTFNSNNLTNMSFMFYGCSSLQGLDLSNFNTVNVKSMSYMFSGCNQIKKLDLSNFNTDNVENMNNMFEYCTLLEEINLSDFYTNKLINMSSMFYKCINLKSLDLSNFNTSNIIDMSYMFFACSSLKK